MKNYPLPSIVFAVPCFMILCSVLQIAVADTPAEVSKKTTTISVESARQQAILMHRIYESTLDAMHHYYFHANKAVIPARAMEAVFEDIARETQARSRWISVNTKAMSIDHEPNSEFEKQAAEAISKGENEFELVEEGVYRRAGAIPLSDGCIGCHTSAFSKQTTIPRFAGLVISIPLEQD